MSSNYKVGELVVLVKENREGYIRYIGPLDGQDGQWYGIELTPKYVGKHDGCADGKKYFNCRPGQGLFVKLNGIKFRKTRRRSISHSKLVSSGNAAIFEERIDKKPNIKDKDNSGPLHKAGPREIGKNSDWKPPKWDDYREDKHGTFLSERPSTLSNSKTEQKKKISKQESTKKLGPREIGKNSDWQPPEWDIKDDSKHQAFLSERLPSFTNKKKSLEQEKPIRRNSRDMRRNSDWSVSNHTENDNNSVLSDDKANLTPKHKTSNNTSNDNDNNNDNDNDNNNDENDNNSKNDNDENRNDENRNDENRNDEEINSKVEELNLNNSNEDNNKNNPDDEYF